jgi:hypothetical protein
MNAADEHQVPREPPPGDDPTPDQQPSPDDDPIPDHNPVTATPPRPPE